MHLGPLVMLHYQAFTTFILEIMSVDLCIYTPFCDNDGKDTVYRPYIP